MQDPNCIFCRIASGDVTANVILRNEKAMALLDAFPLALGHTLVIPTSHHAKLQNMDHKEAEALFEMTWRVSDAVEKGAQTTATTIAIHNGREAGQEIPHVHVHIIPRKRNDGAGPVHSMFQNRPKPAEGEMESIRRKIAGSLS